MGMRRRLRGLFLGIVVLALVIGAAAARLYTSLPRHQGTVPLPGLGAEVRVVRDRNAVPHIFAGSLTDGYRALGYLHAQDRLWQMDFMRRLGAGRLSELLGTWLTDFPLKVDHAARILGLYRRAEASYRAISIESRAVVDAYTDGVNAFLDNRSGALPLEFQLLWYEPEPWRPADSLVWGKIMALLLSGNLRDELLYLRLKDHLPEDMIPILFPDGEDPAPVTLAAAAEVAPEQVAPFFLALEYGLRPTAPQVGASNAWVLSGDHTNTGKPILVNDPHLGLQAPILWYLARLETPEGQRVGGTVPGVPFHILGHNGDIAWGFTTTHSDTQDLVVEKVVADNPNQYLAPDGPQPFTIREEVIQVRFSEPRTVAVRESHNGPIISDLGLGNGLLPSATGTVVALRFTGLMADPDLSGDALAGINRAADWSSFVGALADYAAPQQNMVYADRAGRIGLIAPGHVPVRHNGDGTTPVAGWTGDFDLVGTIPFEDLPRVVDPPSGMLINANNRLVGPDYPFLLTKHWPASYRAQRIGQMIKQGGTQTMVSSQRYLMDTLSLPAQALVPHLTAIEVAEDSREAVALDLLRQWDHRMVRHAPQPLIFYAWLRAFMVELFGDRLGSAAQDYLAPRPRVLLRLLKEPALWCRPPAAIDCVVTAARRSLPIALDRLEASNGTDPTSWRWGVAHVAPLSHPLLGRVPILKSLLDIGIATDGGPFTVNRGTMSFGNEERPFRHVHGAGLRAIYDLADLDRSRFMIATGQSGNPLSPHYDSFVTRWRDGAMITIAGRADDLAADAIGDLRLVPAEPQR